MDTTLENQPSLYDRDFHEWALEQARAIAERRVADIDWANVAEEIESVGKSQRHAIRSHLVKLLAHLAKWEHQPEKRKFGWQNTIGRARTNIAGIIEDSPSLKRHPDKVRDWCWKHARNEAALEMRRKIDTLPETCPYTVEQALDVAFWPGPGWTDDEIADEW